MFGTVWFICLQNNFLPGEVGNSFLAFCSRFLSDLSWLRTNPPFSFFEVCNMSWYCTNFGLYFVPFFLGRDFACCVRCWPVSSCRRPGRSSHSLIDFQVFSMGFTYFVCLAEGSWGRTWPLASVRNWSVSYYAFATALLWPIRCGPAFDTFPTAELICHSTRFHSGPLFSFLFLNSPSSFYHLGHSLLSHCFGAAFSCKRNQGKRAHLGPQHPCAWTSRPSSAWSGPSSDQRSKCLGQTSQ